MAHAEGFTKKDARGVLAEAGRELTKYKNYVDKNRTAQNYQMQGGSSREVITRAQARVNDIMQGKRIQKQSHLVVSWAIHYPKEFCHEETAIMQKWNEETGEMETVERIIYIPNDKEHCKKFMRMMYKEAQLRYGAENVVEGYVHMDETTPHMTVICVPEAISRKTHEHTVSSASKMLKRNELKAFQRILDKRCEKEYGIKNLILNGKTTSNLTMDELKARQAQERDIAEREGNIASREHALDDTSVSLKQRGKNIALKESNLNARAIKLDERDKTITEREKKLRQELREEFREEVKNDFEKNEGQRLRFKFKKQLKDDISVKYEELYKKELKDTLRDSYGAKNAQLMQDLLEQKRLYENLYSELSKEKDERAKARRSAIDARFDKLVDDYESLYGFKDFEKD